MLALGRIAHDATLRRARACARNDFPFGTARGIRSPSGTTLFDSYHCSRYNTNTAPA